MNESENKKLNIGQTEGNAVDANGSIHIDGSPEILKERLELCMLRSASFDPEKVDPAWAEFLKTCLEILEALRNCDNEKLELCKLKITHSRTKLCKPEKLDDETELCKPKESAEGTELCKLQNFWLTELSMIPEEALVPAWETTLQILLEAECAKAENVPVNEKEIRNILYSYLYDYAEDILACSSRECFLTAFLAGSDSNHVRDGLSLFFGDRLKARLLDILEKQPVGTLLQPGGTFPLGRKQPTGTLLQSTGNVPPDRKQQAGNVPACRNLTAHQQKALAEFWQKAVLFMALILTAFSLSACGGKESAGAEGEGVQAVTDDEDAYPDTVAYEDSEQEISDRFGIMHATVLDVQNGEKDGLFIYTLRDKEDPDNAWCLNSQDVGSIVCNVNGGKEVAVLFSGDIINDPDGVEFIAILDDAPYTIKEAEGTTVSNMMNSFTVRTTKGVELNFIKDNCKVDRDALSTEPGSRIRILYTDGGSADHYPLRVYKLPAGER